MTPGDVASTYATGFGDPLALAFNAGNLYVANFEGDSVSRVAPGATTGGTIFVSGLIGPEGLAFDAAGDLFVANLAGTVSEVPPAGGTATTFAPGFDVPTGLAFDSAGNLYVANNGGNTVVKLSQEVTVPFILGGTAVSGKDYSGVTATPLTFTSGQTTLNITGTLLSDPGPSRTLTFTLGTPTGGASPGSPSVNTLTITEPAVVQFGAGSETVTVNASAQRRDVQPRDRELGRRHVQHPRDDLGHSRRHPHRQQLLRLRLQPAHRRGRSTPPATSTSPTPATTR